MNITLNSIENKPYIKPILFLTILLGLVAKVFLFRYEYVDFGFYLSSWINEFKQWGWQKGLSDGSYNYTPPYMYFLILFSKFEINPLYSIKILSILFEYILAFFIGRLIFVYNKQKIAVWISLAIIPLIPTVMLNSAFLSQCDAIYASFVVGSLYFIFVKKQLWAMVFLGIAFSFKLQTMFVLPFYFVFMLRGHIKWYMFLIIPLVYVFSVLPAWFAGRGFFDLLTIYLAQSSYNVELVKNFPNIYHWISGNYSFFKYGMLLVIMVSTLLLGIKLSNKKYIFTLEVWYKLIFLCFVTYPLVLPGMLERYMYLGDVWALIYVCINFRNIIPALGIITVSFYSYIRTIYMFSFSPQADYPRGIFSIFEHIPWELVSIFYIIVVIYLYFGFIATLHKEMHKKEFIHE